MPFFLPTVASSKEHTLRKMGFNQVADKPHVVCIPFPVQGHITPMLKLAKFLHYKGFHITFVNTEYNQKRLLKSRGSNSQDGLPDFRFEAIPDGLPQTDYSDVSQDVTSLADCTSKNCLVPFRNLLYRLNDRTSSSKIPPVTCVVSDGVMSFTLEAAEEFGIPEVLFWTPSACGVLGYTQYHTLVERGLIPLKDDSYLINGYLETTIDWIPGMKNIRLKDLPTLIRTTDPNDIMLNFLIREVERNSRAYAIILNTFHSFERDVLDALSIMFPLIYTIGPLQLLADQILNGNLKNIGSNLWKEQPECIEWLDSKEPNSVVFVNFGSITTITPQQMIEFSWGLANSNKPFLLTTRPDLVVGGKSTTLPPEFLRITEERGMVVSWCPQEEILKHPSVGCFISHMGWNSTLESTCGGVPFLCWPFFAEQQTNCWFACNVWGIGMEINHDVKRDEVEKLVREVMEGEKGKEMRKKAMEWKTKAEEATRPGGSSYQNFENLLEVILQGQRNK